MTSDLEDLLQKIDRIQTEIVKQIDFLKHDISKIDLTVLMDFTAELKEIMLNQAHNPEKNYPQLIANFLGDNPLTIDTLSELSLLCNEFKEFLKS